MNQTALKQKWSVEYYDEREHEWLVVRELRNFDDQDAAIEAMKEYRKQFTFEYRFRVRER